MAVFANGWSAEYLGLVIDSLKKRAARDNTDIFIYTSFILPHEEDVVKENQLKVFDLADLSQFDAAIVLANTFNSENEIKKIKSLVKNAHIPFISSEVKLPGMALVGTSNYQGIYDLARHLIEEHNVKKVIYVRGNAGNVECAERRKALEHALAESGLELYDVLAGDFGFYNAGKAINAWLEEKKPLPDAFVCANDLMALGVISHLHQHGIDVPGDVIVTGFDNVHEAQTSYPLVATVSRQWDHMGEYLYEEALRQIEKHDSSSKTIYPSKFIPSESCGCTPDPKAVEVRLERVRNIYSDSTNTDMIGFFFQRVHIEMSLVEDKEGFFQYAKDRWGHEDFFGKDYCICTSPLLFEAEDEEYISKVRDFKGEMDIMYERRNSESIPQRTYDSDEFYPGYEPDPDRSDIFVFAALVNRAHLIGYLAVKNTPEILTTLQFKRWINNLDTLFINIRHNIFLKRTNAKLNQIYMTDFLTDMYNRMGCDNVLYAFIQAEKEAGRRTMLLFFDINCMKLINDEYGHLNGDLAIKATASAMRESLSDKWMFGRYGGDEFIAVGSYEEGKTIEDYRKAFNTSLKKITTKLKAVFNLSASVGYCVINPDDNSDIDTYIRIADESMYKEKELAHREMGLIS